MRLAAGLLAVLAATGFAGAGDPGAVFEARYGALDGSWCAPLPLRDAENAAVPIREAALLYLEGASGLELRSLSPRPVASWTPVERRRVELALARNGQALALFGELRGRPASDFELAYPPAGYDHFPSPILRGFYLGDLVRDRGRIAAAEGRIADALSDLELLRDLARAFHQERVYVLQGLAIAVERWQLRLAADLLEAPGMSAPQVLRARELLPAADSFEAARQAIACDLLFTAADLSRLDVVGRAMEGELPGEADFTRMSSQLFTWGSGMAPGVYRMAWVGLGNGPVRRRLLARGLEVLDLFSEKVPHREFVSRLGTSTLDWSPVPAEGLIRTFEVELFHRRLAGTVSSRRLLALAAELRLRSLREGGYPASIAGERAADPLTGGGFAYERADDGSAVLRIEGAGEAWGRDSVPPPPFTVTLPAPERAP